MTAPRDRLIDALPGALRTAVFGPPALAFGPALMLSAFWFGGQTALIALAFLMPALLLVLHLPLRLRLALPKRLEDNGTPVDNVIRALDRVLSVPEAGGLTAALALAIDHGEALVARHGPASALAIQRAVCRRLACTLRDGDVIAPEGQTGMVIALAPTRRLDTEALVQLAARLQRLMSDPVPLDGRGLHMTLSVGFCLPRRPEEMAGKACLEAAAAARAEAMRNGPGAIRAFVPGQRQPAHASAALADEIAAAFEAGQITAWFQPQLCTDTGAVSGMEALARWDHPKHGLLLPGRFLPHVAAGGLHRRLTETMLDHALGALLSWERAGCVVPTVAVNFTPADLADPMLSERLKWELDRFDLSPGRLTVEVLETVLAGAGDDIAARTLAELARIGCRIDLDDFGTGHAAIASIRRFSVGRIKIDRSFVAGIDTDPDQQTMVSAILELAQRLGVETLAEGVETVGAHAILAQLGCQHVQGHAIAAPMPAVEAEAWLRRHAAKRVGTLWPGREAG